MSYQVYILNENGTVQDWFFDTFIIMLGRDPRNSDIKFKVISDDTGVTHIEFDSESDATMFLLKWKQ